MSTFSSRHTKTYVLLAMMIACGASGDVLLSKGMKQVGAVAAWTPAALFAFLLKVFLHPVVWLGISGLIAYFVCYSIVLSWADYSYVLPASALTYVLVPLLAHFWLGEYVKTLRWTGIFCIFLGVVLVGSTPHTTTASGSDAAAEGG